MPAERQRDDDRPDPDALLKAADRDAGKRGALRIFLGAAPGVGKTYAMLNAARECSRQDQDVVIGVIETHGRADTERVAEGLERVERQTIEHRGREFQEFDLDAVLERKPEIVLVDELAHRNIPGTRHPRRYQDVEELLDAGIDVWTAVNIQHLESRKDDVARITGVRMRETVPDSLLERARDVMVVDLVPDELIQRLHQGKVYVPEQARAALDGFFGRANLTALRELALDTAARRIDDDVRDEMATSGKEGPWPVRQRVLVAIDDVDSAERLVRLGRRLAEKRGALWTVAYVESGSSPDTRHERIERAFQLAERLGGRTIVLRGYDVAAELLEHARQYNFTAIVLGRGRTRLFAGLLGPSLGQRLLRHGSAFEITFLADPEARTKARRRLRAPEHDAEPWHYGVAMLAVVVATGLAALIDRFVPLGNLSLIYLTAVMLVATATSLYPALLTAFASFVAFDFFFTQPRFTFVMERPNELSIVVFFLVFAVLGAQLATRSRQQVKALRRAGERTETLLRMSRRLASATDRRAIATHATETLADAFDTDCCLLEPGDGDRLELSTSAPDVVELDQRARSAATWANEHAAPAGHGTDTLPAIDWQFHPLTVEDEHHGVVGLAVPQSGSITAEAQQLLATLVRQVALAIGRVRLTEELERSRVGEETERLRSALLSSVSHDLNTPLASMIGAASSLRELGDEMDAERRGQLLDTILEEGERLDRYIQNLLDMTRLGYDTLTIERDWISVEELLSAALRRTRGVLGSLPVDRDLGADLPLLFVHPALIEQALVNVLENAAKFSPDDGRIRIRARQDDDENELEIAIIDQGPGIPEGERKQIFDMFVKGGQGDDSRYGSGLGLAICQGMVGAHGGRIEALPGPEGRGTAVVIHLPLVEEQGRPRHTHEDTDNDQHRDDDEEENAAPRCDRDVARGETGSDKASTP